jgi:hypothetical protein
LVQDGERVKVEPIGSNRKTVAANPQRANVE